MVFGGLIILTMTIIHFLPKLTNAIPSSLAAIVLVSLLVIGFDINRERIKELRKGQDHTLEVSEAELAAVVSENGKTGLWFGADADIMQGCDVFIVTVPTPTNEHNQPVLNPLEKASAAVGKLLKPGNVVIYESTVYPGVTEEVCVPILEKESGLKLNTDFYAGYSPERINPGDKHHTVTKILKVTSGSTPEAAQYIAEILPATHFMRGIRGVVLRDATLADIQDDALWLLGFMLVGLVIASLRFKKRLD